MMIRRRTSQIHLQTAMMAWQITRMRWQMMQKSLYRPVSYSSERSIDFKNIEKLNGYSLQNTDAYPFNESLMNPHSKAKEAYGNSIMTEDCTRGIIVRYSHLI